MPLAELLPPDSTRILTAIAVAAGYIGLCGNAVLGRRRQKRTADPSDAGAPDAGTLLVVYASQTGFAEELARRTAGRVAAAGIACRLMPVSALDAATLATAGRALFILSTTGEGDAPDHAAGFARRVLDGPADLGQLRYGLLALGDRSYRRFCAFGLAVDDWLGRQGAVPLFPPIEVDDGDPAALERWQAALAMIGVVPEQPAAWVEEAQYRPWRLVERRVLNPGSAEHPAFHIAFRPQDGTTDWVAGDLARIAIAAADADGRTPHRDYSIASIPADGRLELLVRLARRPDGTAGLGSGWLTQELAVGDTALLQIRRNAGFHAPDDTRPLILIGNGTGLAGLRAHLKARAARGLDRNWLLFGERSRAGDYFHREEIEGWRRSGVIARLDLAFSRDQDERIYVQHRLRAAAADLTRWVADGAAILVCGSADGMAPAVHAVLTDVLGAESLERLAEDGRYRRDVY